MDNNGNRLSGPVERIQLVCAAYGMPRRLLVTSEHVDSGHL